jgi:poly(beta-D-mannuronate) lyase
LNKQEPNLRSIEEISVPKLTQALCLIFALAGTTILFSQAKNVALNPRASYIDVAARRAELKQTKSVRVRAALAQMGTCSALPVVDAPQGPMRIPMHYLHGGHGPINPAEHAATVPYLRFEKRVTAGMNQFLATGNHAEAACAQDQIDRWAQAHALMDYDAVANAQSWYQVEWTLSAIATSESVLLNDANLEPAETARDIKWMNQVAHRMIGFPVEVMHHNNHHYWRGLAAIATGVISSDQALFDFGVQAYKDGVNEIDQRGAFPREMARSERSIHYQSFALQPLIPIAEFAERQHVPLYSYTSPTGHTIADAIDFLGKAVGDPSIVKVYTPDEQMVDSDEPDFFAAMEFYVHRFPNRKLPASIVEALKKPTYASRLGGSTTVLAGR